MAERRAFARLSTAFAGVPFLAGIQMNSTFLPVSIWGARSDPQRYVLCVGGGGLALPLRQRDEQTGAGDGEVGGDHGDGDGYCL